MSKKFHATLNRLVEQSANNNPRQGRQISARKNPEYESESGISIYFDQNRDLLAYERFEDGGTDVEFSDKVNVVGKRARFKSCSELQEYLRLSAEDAAVAGEPTPTVTAVAEEEIVIEDAPLDLSGRFTVVEEEEEEEVPQPVYQRQSSRTPSYEQPEMSDETLRAIAKMRSEGQISGRYSSRPQTTGTSQSVRKQQYHLFQTVCQAPNLKDKTKGPRLRFALYAKDPTSKRAVAPFVKLDQSLLVPGTRRGKKREEKNKALQIHFEKWSPKDRAITQATFERFFSRLRQIRLPKLLSSIVDKDGKKIKPVDYDLRGVTERERHGPLLQPVERQIRKVRRLADGTVEDLGYEKITELVRPGLDKKRTTFNEFTGTTVARKAERLPFQVMLAGKMHTDQVAWELASRIALGTFLAETGYLGRGDAKILGITKKDVKGNQALVDDLSDKSRLDCYIFADELPISRHPAAGLVLDYATLSTEKNQWFRVGSLMTASDEMEANDAAVEEMVADDEESAAVVDVAETVAGASTPRPEAGPRKGRVDIDNG